MEILVLIFPILSILGKDILYTGPLGSASILKVITNFPVLINTSFNIRGEPIVNTPQDAFNCFMVTELDILVIGNCYLEKNKQNKNLKKDYKNKF